MKDEDQVMEESGSARFNADQMTRTVQARIESNKTSQGVTSSGGTMIYSREPNRKNSVFIGNMTWWTTDMDLIRVVQEAGLGEVKNIKFYENRTNGQSKGYALVELSSEQLATIAQDKLQLVTINEQKPFVMYALRISPHAFEAKCNAAKSGITSAATASSGTMMKTTPRPAKPSLPVAPPIRPPGPMPGLGGPLAGMPPPPIPGLPPGFPGGAGMMAPNLPGLAGLLPPRLPPPGLPGTDMRPGFGLPFAMRGADQMKTPGAHLNPAFLQEMAQNGSSDPSKSAPQNMMELFSRFRNMAAAQSGVGTGGGSVPMSGEGARQPSEDEASDANQRNRAISSSAIHRALAYSKSGDFEDAIDTLNLAIGLIRQSVTGNTESSQIIIQTLSDCLRGVEEQSAAMAKRSRREHRSHDDRDRGSRSSHRSKHHRDRSRERRR